MIKNNHFSKIIYEDLSNKYGFNLTKKELAEVLKVSVSSINNYIVRGEGIPEYLKMGTSKNSKVLFPVVNVVDYLSNTIKVA
ncbi:MAG: helix-turn-helix domain-containing protein [Sulfurimonas sp.]|nr:helix-turn-helix domain-containing protein [Sulfurimonas sp.]